MWQPPWIQPATCASWGIVVRGFSFDRWIGKSRAETPRGGLRRRPFAAVAARDADPTTINPAEAALLAPAYDPPAIALPVASGSASLIDWLPRFATSSDYDRLIRRFRGVEGRITAASETALLYAVIHRSRPALSLEIGTLFGLSTRIMAEAVVDSGANGRIITLDPFGAERVPGILASWPKVLRQVVEFRPHNSMQYFLDLETAGTAKGADSPLGVSFVDGHHSFEYALFDIMRSADHTVPGGAIFVDNLEQEGPKSATLQFLRWNPAWSVLYEGRLFASHALAPEAIVYDGGEEAPWAVLLAPDGIQCARHLLKMMKRGIPYVPVRAISFALRHVTHPGRLSVNLSYYAVPFDFHITGRGMSLQRFSGTLDVPGTDEAASLAFPHGLELQIEKPDQTNVCYEIELSFQSDESPDAYILLDAHQPLSLLA